MSSDDNDATDADAAGRQQRARELRQLIDAVTNPDAPADEPVEESSRDFVHRRMKELEDDEAEESE